MLSVLKDYILEEEKSADFIIIQDETTDISIGCQLLLILRYIDANSNIQKQFMESINIPNTPSCKDE